MGRIPGDELFRLHDTFGLRPDFVRDIVKSCDDRLDIDLAGYEAEMTKQRERARSNWKGQLGTAFKPVYGEAWKLYQELPEEFSPERTPLARDAKIVALVVDDQLVRACRPARRRKSSLIPLPSTPSRVGKWAMRAT